ncbi:GntR family transcriptional regulator / MocR family aminotransferase [Proteiniborus ethanoligenes]|uniref:GntR family transcriptional regulator / MocR family aminotransferase n=1 Tax=Proteiniborus ethanoligenes TaxID=415015 RepID=A0A1H3QH17_9FIRM|nr:PLP-dependent aminotransferase family protein [Proteiniborus ethanoligenes]SDZ12421.1 GntR family transcriptional regulator / MocR family aminotransferase [Proteiniborus ethanoligenes]
MNMLTFTIDLDSSIPIYHQLYDYIKSEIQSGKITYNTKLPSKRKLSAHLKISQNTIQAAYDQLIEEGYVASIERKGFYVCKLDNIVRIKVPKENNKNENKNSIDTVKYDFSYHGVDMETFPFSIWRRLTRDAINEYDKELVKLGDSQGSMSLRNSIAEYLRQSRGVNCSGEQIIISAGTEYLFQILIQLFDKDSVYGIENPGYEKLNLLFNSNRANFKAIKIDSMGMILEEIIKSNGNILCITPSHQFPSGSIMPINRRIQLLNWANEKDERYIIEDDYDSEFKYNGRPIPALQGLDRNGKVIYMGAFSKSLSPSIRISYMVLPEKLLKKYLEKLSFIICPVPSIEQKVLHRFIHDGYFERHLNKMRNVYKKKREILVGKITELDKDIEIMGADAGLHLLLRINNGMTEKELVETALKVGVKVYGLSKYYVDKSYIGEKPTILLGYASMTEEDIVKAIEILYKAWFKKITITT